MAYITHFDPSLHSGATEDGPGGYGRWEQDTYFNLGEENQAEPPIVTGRFLLDPGEYEVLILSDGDTTVQASVGFAGLAGTSSMSLTGRAVGVATLEMPVAIRAISKLKAEGLETRWVAEGYLQGKPPGSGVSAFFLWMTRSRNLKDDLRTCLAGADTEAFDEKGRCTGVGAHQSGRTWGSCTLCAGKSLSSKGCHPLASRRHCDSGDVGFAYRGEIEGLDAPRLGGFALFLAWT